MDLKLKIEQDLLSATKASEILTRDTLRALKNAIKNSEINKGRTLDDQEIIETLSKELKQRQESAIAFRDGNRPELAEKEENEISIIKEYLPPQLDERAIGEIVDQAIASLGQVTISDIGKIMAIVIPQTKGKADGNLVNQIVQSKIS